MENKKLKWAILQPLTGGMYFGAEAAFGHPAEFIISFPGFNAPVFNKKNELISGANEYHLCEYLKKKNRMVPFYHFDRTPFQYDNNLNPVITQVDGPEHQLSYEDIDVVLAVPVCAGLSGATSNATDEKKSERNCNMIWLAKYALNTIRPKIYIFENAPRLTSGKGEPVRVELEKIARNAGYSIAYYHTDTKVHENCQIRPRTFVYFFRIDEENRQGCPQLGYENLPLTIAEKLDGIPADATQQVTLPIEGIQKATLDYIIYSYGDNWREQVLSGSLIGDIILRDKLDEWNQWVQDGDVFTDNEKKRIARYVGHIHEKHSMGLGFYARTPVIAQRDGMPSCMFKTMPNVIHYKENRLYTLREWMTVMGFPYDFEMQGDIFRCYSQIGQNVPARTAQFIASEAKRIVEEWNTVQRAENQNVMFVDNIKQTFKIVGEKQDNQLSLEF